MQVAIALFDRFTALDAVGPYEVLSRLPGVETVFVAERPGPLANDLGSLTLLAAAEFGAVTRPDIVVVPGGPGQVTQTSDGALADWLRTVDQASTWTTSVCTGSLILAAAGLLQGRRATTHWSAVDQLPGYGAVYSPERVVTDGKYVTAAGVSAGIDMALTLAAVVAGVQEAQAVQLIVEYDPQPPFDAGSIHSAPQHVLEAVRERLSASRS